MKRTIKDHGSYRIVRKFAIFPRRAADIKRTEEIYFQYYYVVRRLIRGNGWWNYWWMDDEYFSTKEAAQEYIDKRLISCTKFKDKE